MLQNNSVYQKDSDEDTKTSVVKDFLALIKIGIINSNLITATTGIWLALYYNDLKLFDNLDKVIFAIVGTWLVIGGAGSLNNFIDRDIDVKMSRTKKRPTVSGNFSPAFALTIGLGFVTIGALFLFQTTFVSGLIGLFGVFAYVILYTVWSKRRFTLNTVVGSISGAVPPLIGWAAIDGNLHTAAWILFLIMFIWQIPHFLALAMRRTEEYRAANIPMLPVVHGFAMTKRQIIVWIVCLFPLPFYLSELGIPFLVLATILNIGWLALGIIGYKSMDDIKWANRMFIFSLNYLTIMFVSMIIFTLI
ncbi:heme o synthase [Caldibacillus lycopersici]|uniref:Protoheme IX farnesyltransferase n=1 Tax=Perspicuibacillus lycopersici TaxID=1325689 RepID=A0AAE3LLT1_9BACI|nr:heme o synthase [Perspicuibacillus lycopersici]MCU9612236.1 heme o synthase [Perspicuibacillus lycopersici]